MEDTKLTVAQLACYLPYATQIISSYDNTTTVLAGKMLDEKHFYKYFTVLEFKPILRPIGDIYTANSDLQTIELDILKETKLYVDSGPDIYIGHMEGEAPYISLLICNEALNIFFKNKIDVFGLIPKGLAVSLHSLTTLPGDNTQAETNSERRDNEL